MRGAARMRALHAAYAGRVRAHALAMREDAAALMRVEAEIAAEKAVILGGECGARFEPVGFEPYGTLDEQVAELGAPMCPAFADIHEAMDELVRHCEAVLAATAAAAPAATAGAP